jgi:diacylglycerol kinase family enzyme
MLPERLLPSADDIGNLVITVLMNTRSGNENNPEAVRIAIEALRAQGRDVALLQARRPRDLPMLVRQAADTRPGILVAAGGDGTLNAVASMAHARALPFAVIPLGTFNYFARDLGIPLDAAEAARIIGEGCVRSVPIGCVNGKLFLNNASIGLYRRLIERRELHKRRFGRRRLVALFSGLFTLLGRNRSYRLRLEIDGQPLILSAPTVFFGRNALQMEQLGLGEALCVARGELAVLAPREVDRRALLGLALRGALGRLESAENLRQYCASKVQVDWLDGRRIRVAVDGELIECALPLVIEALPNALQVIVPRQPGTGS